MSRFGVFSLTVNTRYIQTLHDSCIVSSIGTRMFCNHYLVSRLLHHMSHIKDYVPLAFQNEYEQAVVYSQWSLNCPKHCSTAKRHWKRGAVEGRPSCSHSAFVKAYCWFKYLKSAYHSFGRCPCHLAFISSIIFERYFYSFISDIYLASF